MIDVGRLFDPYSRQARLYPALLTLLPAIALIVALVPALLGAGVGGELLAFATSCGAVFLLADISRALGKRIEPRLLFDWGGWPTTIALRHSSASLNPATKARYHAFLGRNVTGLVIPTTQYEQQHQIEADDFYASAVDWLKEQCRGPDFALLLRENATYGFRRNMLGLKPVALVVCAITVCVSTVILAAHSGLTFTSPHLFEKPSALSLSLAIVLIVALVAGSAWLILVRRSWVKKAADTYATTLLSCCDKLPDGNVGKQP